MKDYIVIATDYQNDAVFVSDHDTLEEAVKTANNTHISVATKNYKYLKREGNHEDNILHRRRYHHPIN